MRLTALSLIALLPLPAFADCGLTLAQTRALAPGLVGTWNSTALQGIVLSKGVPSPLPLGGDAPAGVFSLGGDDLVIEEAVGDAPLTLDPMVGVADFALPGESPLFASELLTGLVDLPADCAAEHLPQFHGTATAPGMGDLDMHLFVIGPDQMVNVITVHGPGDPAAATFVRALVDFRR